jgi:hypothetical protein
LYHIGSVSSFPVDGHVLPFSLMLLGASLCEALAKWAFLGALSLLMALASHWPGCSFSVDGHVLPFSLMLLGASLRFARL